MKNVCYSIAVTILVALSVPFCMADENSDDFAGADRSVKSKLFKFAYDEWGSRQRTISLLQRCENFRIASQLMINSDIKTRKLKSQLFVIRNENPELDDYLGKLTPRETSALIQSVMYMLTFYGLGYAEAVETVVENMSGDNACQLGLLMANQIFENETPR